MIRDDLSNNPRFSEVKFNKKQVQVHFQQINIMDLQFVNPVFYFNNEGHKVFNQEIKTVFHNNFKFQTLFSNEMIMYIGTKEAKQGMKFEVKCDLAGSFLQQLYALFIIPTIESPNKFSLCRNFNFFLFKNIKLKIQEQFIDEITDFQNFSLNRIFGDIDKNAQNSTNQQNLLFKKKLDEEQYITPLNFFFNRNIPSQALPIQSQQFLSLEFTLQNMKNLVCYEGDQNPILQENMIKQFIILTNQIFISKQEAQYNEEKHKQENFFYFYKNKQIEQKIQNHQQSFLYNNYFKGSTKFLYFATQNKKYCSQKKFLHYDYNQCIKRFCARQCVYFCKKVDLTYEFGIVNDVNKKNKKTKFFISYFDFFNHDIQNTKNSVFKQFKPFIKNKFRLENNFLQYENQKEENYTFFSNESVYFDAPFLIKEEENIVYFTYSKDFNFMFQTLLITQTMFDGLFYYCRKKDLTLNLPDHFSADLFQKQNLLLQLKITLKDVDRINKTSEELQIQQMQIEYPHFGLFINNFSVDLMQPQFNGSLSFSNAKFGFETKILMKENEEIVFFLSQNYIGFSLNQKLFNVVKF